MRRLVGSMKNLSGAATMASISAGFGCAATGEGRNPTNGVIAKPETTVSTSSRRPHTSINPGGMSISSRVSRMAVARRSGSCASCCPPGNEIWPLWCSTSSVRFVSIRQGMPPETKIGTRTAARRCGFGGRSRASRAASLALSRSSTSIPCCWPDRRVSPSRDRRGATARDSVSGISQRIHQMLTVEGLCPTTSCGGRQEFPCRWGMSQRPPGGRPMHPQLASVDGSPSQRQRDIYLLSPRLLPPEVIAVAFAKTSRSPRPFREIAEELTESTSSEFHEKWVLGYGHGSVAEHAVLHLALENLSRLAIESLESNRLCSYTEKSTRYQIFDAFYVPPAIAASGHAERYAGACRELFEAYQASLDPVRRVIESWHPRKADETERAYGARIRSKYIDVCRFLLPCATLANVGMTANARALEHAITKMLSHPLEEVRAIGTEVKRVAAAEVPTLLKYANPNPYL